MIEVGKQLSIKVIEKHKLSVRILSVVLLLLVSALVTSLSVGFVNAEGQDSQVTPVVIKSLQTGDTISAANEFVQIANNTGEPVDVTGWCVFYQPAGSSATARQMSCLNPEFPNAHIFIQPQGVVTLFSETFATNYPVYNSDYTFGLSMSWTGGYVFVADAKNETVDLLGWGNVNNPEGGPSAAAPSIQIFGTLQRKLNADATYQDTNNNKNDFDLHGYITMFASGMIYEVVDQCTNIDGLQDVIPDDYSESEGVCEEVEQEEVPESTPSTPPQEDYPASIEFDRNIRLNELLPNPIGSDDNNEFIELHNPNSYDVPMGGYKIMFSDSPSKVLTLTDEQIIPQNGYLVLSNSTYAFTMVNTADSITLLAPDSSTISQTSYQSAGDGKSWALVNGEWQYTTEQTPNAQNIIPIVSVESEDNGATLTPCPSGQYRNPETNRCRKIANTDQDSTLIPCKDGQERNPETNRCRKIISSDTPKADYAVLSQTSTNDSANSSYVFWVVGGVVALGVAYILWEWRQEIIAWWKKLVSRFRSTQ